MFELSFSEIVVIAIVALLVLGPERLPPAARMVGFWLGRIRAQWEQVKWDLERELDIEQLRQERERTRQALLRAQAFCVQAQGSVPNHPVKAVVLAATATESGQDVSGQPLVVNHAKSDTQAVCSPVKGP